MRCRGWRRRGRRGRRGCYGPRTSEIELVDQRRCHPGHLLVVGCTRHPDAGAVENLLGGQIRDAQLLDELADKQAVWPAALIDHLARRSGVHRERPVRRIERGEPRRRRPKATLERVASGRIDNDDLYFGAFALHLRQQRIEADAVPPDLRLGPDLGVDGNQIGLPRDLDAIAAEIEQGHHAGADLADEGIDRALHIFPADILFEVDIEFGSTKLVGKRAGIADRGGKRRAGIRIVCVSNQERHARGLLRQRRMREDCGSDRDAQAKDQPHVHCVPFVPIGTNFTNVMAVATNTLARDISSRSAAYQSVLPSRPSRWDLERPRYHPSVGSFFASDHNILAASGVSDNRDGTPRRVATLPRAACSAAHNYGWGRSDAAGATE